MIGLFLIRNKSFPIYFVFWPYLKYLSYEKKAHKLLGLQRIKLDYIYQKKIFYMFQCTSSGCLFK